MSTYFPFRSWFYWFSLLLVQYFELSSVPVYIQKCMCNTTNGLAIIAKYPFIFPTVRGALNHAWFCFCAFVQCLVALYCGYFVISKTICREIKQFSDIWSTICSAETLPHIFYVIVCSVPPDCAAESACLMNRHNNTNDISPVYLFVPEYLRILRYKRGEKIQWIR